MEILAIYSIVVISCFIAVLIIFYRRQKSYNKEIDRLKKVIERYEPIIQSEILHASETKIHDLATQVNKDDPEIENLKNLKQILEENGYGVIDGASAVMEFLKNASKNDPIDSNITDTEEPAPAVSDDTDKELSQVKAEEKPKRAGRPRKVTGGTARKTKRNASQIKN